MSGILDLFRRNRAERKAQRRLAKVRAWNQHCADDNFKAMAKGVHASQAVDVADGQLLKMDDSDRVIPLPSAYIGGV